MPEQPITPTDPFLADALAQEPSVAPTAPVETPTVEAPVEAPVAGPTEPATGTAAPPELKQYQMPDGKIYAAPANIDAETVRNNILDNYGDLYPDLVKQREEKKLELGVKWRQGNIDRSIQKQQREELDSHLAGWSNVTAAAMEGFKESATAKITGFEAKELGPNATPIEAFAYQMSSMGAQLPEFGAGMAIGMGIAAVVEAPVLVSAAIVTGSAFAFAAGLNAYLDIGQDKNSRGPDDDIQTALIAATEGGAVGAAISLTGGVGQALGGSLAIGKASLAAARTLPQKELNALIAKEIETKVGASAGEFVGLTAAPGFLERERGSGDWNPRIPTVYDATDAAAILGTIWVAKTGLKHGLGRVQAHRELKKRQAAGDTLETATKDIAKELGIDIDKIGISFNEQVGRTIAELERSGVVPRERILETVGEVNRIHNELFGRDLDGKAISDLRAEVPAYERLLTKWKEDAQANGELRAIAEKDQIDSALEAASTAMDKGAELRKSTPVRAVGPEERPTGPNEPSRVDVKGDPSRTVEEPGPLKGDASIDAKTKALDDAAAARKEKPIGGFGDPAKTSAEEAALGTSAGEVKAGNGTGEPVGSGRSTTDVMEAIFGPPKADPNAPIDPSLPIDPSNPFERYQSLPVPEKSSKVPKGAVEHSGVANEQVLWDWFQTNPNAALELLNNAEKNGGLPTAHTAHKVLGKWVGKNNLASIMDTLLAIERPEALKPPVPKAERRAALIQEATKDRGLPTETLPEVLAQTNGTVLGKSKDGTHVTMEMEGIQHTLTLGKGESPASLLIKLGEAHANFLDKVNDNMAKTDNLLKNIKDIPAKAQDPIMSHIIDQIHAVVSQMVDLVNSGHARGEAYKALEANFRHLREAAGRAKDVMRNRVMTRYSQASYEKMTKEQLALAIAARGIRLPNTDKTSHEQLVGVLLAHDAARYGDLPTHEKIIDDGLAWLARGEAATAALKERPSIAQRIINGFKNQVDIQGEVSRPLIAMAKKLQREGKSDAEIRHTINYFNALRNVGEASSLAAQLVAESITGNATNFVLPGFLRKYNPYVKAVKGGPASEADLLMLNKYLTLQTGRNHLLNNPDSKLAGLSVSAANKAMAKLLEDIGPERAASLLVRAGEVGAAYEGILAKLASEGLISAKEAAGLFENGINPILVVRAAQEGASPGVHQSMAGLFDRARDGLRDQNIGEGYVYSDAIELVQTAAANAEAAVVRNRATKELSKLAETPGAAEMGIRKAAYDPVTKTYETVAEGGPNKRISYWENGVEQFIIAPKAFVDAWNYHGMGAVAQNMLSALNLASGQYLFKQHTTGLLSTFWAAIATQYDYLHIYSSVGELGQRYYSRELIRYTGQIVKDLHEAGRDLKQRPGALIEEALSHGARLMSLRKDAEMSRLAQKNLTTVDYVKINEAGLKRNAKKFSSEVGSVLGMLSDGAALMMELAEANRAKKAIAAREGIEVSQLNRNQLTEAYTASSRRMAFRDSGVVIRALDNTIAPYLSAAVQGTRGVARNAFKTSLPAAAQAAELIGIGFLATSASLAMNAALHQQLPDYMAGNIVFTPPPALSKGFTKDGEPTDAVAMIRIDHPLRPLFIIGEGLAYGAQGLDYDWRKFSYAAKQLLSSVEFNDLEVPVQYLIASFANERYVRNSVSKGLQQGDSTLINGLLAGQDYVSPDKAELFVRKIIGKTSLTALGLDAFDHIFGKDSPLDPETQNELMSFANMANNPGTSRIFSLVHPGSGTREDLEDAAKALNNNKLTNSNGLEEVMNDIALLGGKVEVSNPRIRKFIEGVKGGTEKARLYDVVARTSALIDMGKIIQDPQLYREFKQLSQLDGAAAAAYYEATIKTELPPEAIEAIDQQLTVDPALLDGSQPTVNFPEGALDRINAVGPNGTAFNDPIDAFKSKLYQALGPTWVKDFLTARLAIQRLLDGGIINRSQILDTIEYSGATNAQDLLGFANQQTNPVQ